jgi:hypothetical protein
MRGSAVALLSCLVVLTLATLASTQTKSYADQVKTIQDDSRVKNAMRFIDNTRNGILSEWIAITEVNAPSKQEQERAKYIESILRKYNVSVRYDAVGKSYRDPQGNWRRTCDSV